MADGDGGGGGKGGGWSRDARPEVYHGHALNPTPMGGPGEGGSRERSKCSLNVSDKSKAEREQQRLSTLVNQEKVVLPIASRISPPTDLVSSDPSVGFIEPPPVPESFPRDPVPQGGRGEGWPYAPQGWPNPDDKWGWRVGHRASVNSLWANRYITVPVSLAKGRRTTSKIEFASRKTLAEFLRQTFPQMKDPCSIFKAFDWKVPAPKNFEAAEWRGSSVKRDKPSPTFGEENEQRSKRQCPGKLQTTLLAALKKAQEGADIVESCKELTEQLHELRSGQGVHDSQVSHQEPNWKVSRKREWEDPLHPSETTTDKTVPESNPVGSPDAQIDSMIASQGACEDGVATTRGTRVEPDLDKDKDLPSTSLQDSPKPEDHVSSITTSETPSELLSCTPFLSSVLDRGSLTVESHENQVVLPEAEATPSTGLPGAEELVTLIHSSSRVKSSSIFNSQDAAEDNSRQLNRMLEVEEAIVHNASGSFKTIQEAQRPMMNDHNKTTEDAGGDDTASTKSIKVSKSSRILRPRTSSSEAKGSSLANSQEVGGDDAVITQIIEVPMAEPLTVPSFDPALETAHAAGMEAEFEERIKEALEKLKRAQAAEYARAEESLNAQKKIVIEQYRQLENDAYVQFGKKENAHVFPHKLKMNHRDKTRAEIDRAMKNLMAQYEKAQEGQKAFDFMLAISNGFGQVSKELLRKFFNWPPSDIIEA